MWKKEIFVSDQISFSTELGFFLSRKDFASVKINAFIVANEKQVSIAEIGDRRSSVIIFGYIFIAKRYTWISPQNKSIYLGRYIDRY